MAGAVESHVCIPLPHVAVLTVAQDAANFEVSSQDSRMTLRGQSFTATQSGQLGKIGLVVATQGSFLNPSPFQHPLKRSKKTQFI